MHFSTLLLATAAAASSFVSASPVARTGHGQPPSGVSESQWQGIWQDCEKQQQNGLINVGVDACVSAEVAALLKLLTNGKRHGGPTVDESQFQAAQQHCGEQQQNGLLNIGVDACVVAEIEAIVKALTNGKRHEERTGGGSIDQSQFQAAQQHCSEQQQNGLLNIGVDACILAEVEAIIKALTNEKRTYRPPGVSESQFQEIQQKCAAQQQNGLINIGIDACVAAEVAAIIKALTNGKRHYLPPSVDESQYQAIEQKCSKQQQNGLINIGVDACIAAEIAALVKALTNDKRHNLPSGISESQFQEIKQKCAAQQQNGLINVGVDACVAAEVAALVKALTNGKRHNLPAGISESQYQAIQQKCSKQQQNGLINVGVDACVAAEVAAIVKALTNGKRHNLPAGVSESQYQAIEEKCSKQQQNGLINVGVDACVAAEVAALVKALTNGKRSAGPLRL